MNPDDYFDIYDQKEADDALDEKLTAMPKLKPFTPEYNAATSFNINNVIKNFRDIAHNKYSVPDNWKDELKNQLYDLQGKDWKGKSKDLNKRLRKLEKKYGSRKSNIDTKLRLYRMENKQRNWTSGVEGKNKYDIEQAKGSSNKFVEYFRFQIGLDSKLASKDFRYFVTEFFDANRVLLDEKKSKRIFIKNFNTNEIIYSTNMTAADGKIATIEQVLMELESVERYSVPTSGEIYIDLQYPAQNKGGNATENMIKKDFGIVRGFKYVPTNEYCGQICLYLTTISPKTIARFIKLPKARQMVKLQESGLLDKYPNPLVGVHEFVDEKDLSVYNYTGNDLENVSGGEYYDAKFKERKSQRVILLYDKHYYLITKPKSVFKRMGFEACEGCGELTTKLHHCLHLLCDCGQQCKNIEIYQKHTKKIINENCIVCNVPLMYEQCKTSHKCLKGKKRCVPCNRDIKVSRMQEHVRNGHEKEIKCGNCGKYDNINFHRCFILPSKVRKSKECYAYDIECYAKEVNKLDDDGKVISSYVEQEFAMMSICKIDDEKTMETFTTICELIEWLNDRKEPTLLFAHNGGKYDNIIIREGLIRSNIKISKVIQSGNKIIEFTVGKTKFRDSVFHLSMPLSKLPKAFDIPNVSKTMFPYDFFTKENKNFTGVVPIEYYNLSSDEKIRDAQIDEVNSLGEFNLFNLCKEYCENDVRILAEGLRKYQESMLKIADLDPLIYITKASFVMDVYKIMYMEEGSISYLQPHIAKFIRRGFYGGRTNCIRKYYKGEFKSLDISSEYPTVQKFDMLPGHLIEYKSSVLPVMQNTDFQKVCNKYIQDLSKSSVVGYFECDITPPKQLLHPVLPIRKDKLFFSLENISKGVYYTSELLLAIKKGYVITKIYSQATFEGTTDLFAEFVEEFYKLKTSCKDRPALYSSVKIILNALWGKFGERSYHDRTEIFSESDLIRYRKFLQKEIKGSITYKSSLLIGCNEGHALLYAYEEDVNYYVQTKGNIAVAAAVTSCGRVRLYEAIDYYNEDVLYFDTDSVYFIDGKKEPFETKMIVDDETGLGKWDVEIEDGCEFVSLGPKMYSYRRTEGPTGVRTKGVANDKLSFEIMKNLVDKMPTQYNFENNELVENEDSIHAKNPKQLAEDNPEVIHPVVDVRFKMSALGVTIDKKFVKNIRVTCDKRLYYTCDGEHISIPLGYEFQD